MTVAELKKILDEIPEDRMQDEVRIDIGAKLGIAGGATEPTRELPRWTMGGLGAEQSYLDVFLLEI